MNTKFYVTITFLLSVVFVPAFAQKVLKGKVIEAISKEPVAYASVVVEHTMLGASTDTAGHFQINLDAKNSFPLKLTIAFLGMRTQKIEITDASKELVIEMQSADESLDEVVVTGTLKEVRKEDSPIPVEVFSNKFFQRNQTSNLFESLVNVNGVRPQLNCAVCNTGDIHINGMEGAYTMVMIDGMVNMSGLSTVYGLSGIPNSMIERVEITKGPASTLYGSEAMAGVINVITKSAVTAPRLSLDLFGTSEKEYNADFTGKLNLGFAQMMLGANYYHFKNPRDINHDNFTDITQQERFSTFGKWDFKRADKRTASLGARFYKEDRWGGELQWQPRYRGTDIYYGESIQTERYELFGKYQLPTKEKIFLLGSINHHQQRSAYGNMIFDADQTVALAQAYWDLKIGTRHDALLGVAYRYTFYDDNSPATATSDTLRPLNMPSRVHLPGVFAQDEISLAAKHKLLLGLRYDYHSVHGHILTPRLSYKWSPSNTNTFRLTLGSGYRVVNVFTEDHAALTTARKVEIAPDLAPERSFNVNLNYVRKFFASWGFVSLDASAFYTYFSNQILPDYTDPEKIVYANLRGHGVTQGFSLNSDFNFNNGLRISAGATFLESYKKEPDASGIERKTPRVLAPQTSGTFTISYTIPRWNLSIDYTGNVSGPMYLPVFPNDYRPAQSPWYSLQNIQFTKKFKHSLEVYAGCKNIFDFFPKGDVIMRAFDPFDRTIGVDNPNNFTFDPTYNYAPMQGRKVLVGLRWSFK